MTRESAIESAIIEAFDYTVFPDDVRTFLASLAASGYAIVPVEATEEMAAAAVGPSFTQRFAAKSIYAAMLAAAQKEQG